jgi:uncharacterized protein YkwD
MPAAARRLAACCAVLAALALPASALADCPGADGPPAGPDGAAATLCLLNAERAAHDLAQLAPAAQLEAAAREHATAMVAGGFFAHESPDGRTLLDRLRAAGWLHGAGDWTAGEDIAWGSGELGTPAGVVAAWMASPGHRANILTPGFDEVGVGIAAGAPVPGVAGVTATYVADFGARDGGGETAAPASAPARAATTRRAPAPRCARVALRRTGHGRHARRALARCRRA